MKLFGKLCFLSFVALEANKEANDATLEQWCALEVKEVLFNINDFVFLNLGVSHLGFDPRVFQ